MNERSFSGEIKRVSTLSPAELVTDILRPIIRNYKEAVYDRSSENWVDTEHQLGSELEECWRSIPRALRFEVKQLLIKSGDWGLMRAVEDLIDQEELDSEVWFQKWSANLDREERQKAAKGTL